MLASDAGVGDDDIELGDTLCLELLDSVHGVSRRSVFNLDQYDLAALGRRQRSQLLSGSALDVADRTDDSVVWPGEILFDESLSESCQNYVRVKSPVSEE